MKVSVGVEYALHCLLPMVDLQGKGAVTIKALAQYQNISETYLSKMFTKLTKAGITAAVPGVKGGYKIARPLESISFLDVFEAIEGKAPFFRCGEIRQQMAIVDKDNLGDAFTKRPCTIHAIMDGAEKAYKDYLAQQTLASLHQHVYQDVLPDQDVEAEQDWFANWRN